MIARTTEAVGTLFAVLSSRNDRNGTAIFEAPAGEHKPGANADSRAIWVGRVNQEELDRACPRNSEVQALANEAAAHVTASGNYLSPQGYENKVYKRIADEVRSMSDRNFIAGKSYDTSGNPQVPYGTSGSIRLDVLEQSIPLTVCVYDHKTGQQGLKPRRAVDIATIVARNFPAAKRIVVIEIRPQP